MYQLTQRFLQARDFLESSDDFDDETIKNTLDGIQMPIEEKALDMAAHIKNLGLIEESVLMAIDDLKFRLNRVRKYKEKYTNYLIRDLSDQGLERVDGTLFDVQLVRNPGRLNIFDETLIDEKFYITPEPVRYADRKTIKELLKKGVEVSGAELIKDFRLKIE